MNVIRSSENACIRVGEYDFKKWMREAIRCQIWHKVNIWKPYHGYL